MSQWGTELKINGMRFIPWLDGQWFAEILPNNKINNIYLIEIEPWAVPLLYEQEVLLTRFLDHPYSEWLEFVSATKRARITP